MTDFYTKKQSKFWCKDCKIFIEYTHLIIEQHNRSQLHKRNVQRTTSFDKQKKYNDQFLEKRTANGGQAIPYLQKAEDSENKNNPFFNVPMRGSKKNHTQQINNIPTIYNQYRKNDSIESDMHAYNESNNYLEEIKREKAQKEFYLKNKKLMKKNKQRIWGLFYDESSGLNYYFNFITNQSQWEKPDDYDGPDIDALNDESAIELEGTSDSQKKKKEKNKLKIASDVGVIGKWESVDSKDSFFIKNKAKDEDDDKYNPYEKKTYEELFEEYEEDEEDDNNEDSEDSNEKELGDNLLEEKLANKRAHSRNKEEKTIDFYINQDQDNPAEVSTKEKDVKEKVASKVKPKELSIDKDQLFEINKKLLERDYDFRYSSNTFDNEDKNINRVNGLTNALNKDSSEHENEVKQEAETEPITIVFKKRKK